MIKNTGGLSEEQANAIKALKGDSCSLLKLSAVAGS
jgi:hypothetical protein